MSILSLAPPLDRPPTLTLVPDLPPVTVSDLKAAEARIILGHIRLYESLHGCRDGSCSARHHTPINFNRPQMLPTQVAIWVGRYNTLAAELGLTDHLTTPPRPLDVA